MVSLLARCFFIFFAFILTSISAQAETKPNLVLLPIDVSESETQFEDEYGSALQQGLQRRYTVFYGASVEKELDREYDKIDCNTETCNQNVAIAFNGELIADSSVTAINGGYLLKLVIRNVITGEVLETETMPCESCSVFTVINRLKNIGAGTVSQLKSGATRGQGGVNESGSQPAQITADARAILIFDSQPSDADVYINNKKVGTTPYQGLNHQIGEQLQIQLKNDSYRPYELEVALNQAITQLEPLILEAGQGQVILAFPTEPPLSKKLGIEMVDIPGGRFMMGSNVGGDREKPVHQVTLGGFQLGKYEITQGQWQAVMGNNPSDFSSCGDTCPVENVSWDDIHTFLKKLNQQSGGSYRLPTEAEWEYACRSGGKNETYCGGNELDRLAWYSKNSNGKTHPVGQKQANGLGLYDMSGNVWEWVQDWKGAYSNGQVIDPTGPASGYFHVFRGGSWDGSASFNRSAIRRKDSPRFDGYRLGFRLAR